MSNPKNKLTEIDYAIGIIQDIKYKVIDRFYFNLILTLSRLGYL